MNNIKRDPSTALGMTQIGLKKEAEKIIRFIQGVLKKTGLKDIVIGWSGGIDSSVCLYLLARALPSQNIHVLHMPYSTTYINELKSLSVKELKIQEVTIKNAVDTLWQIIEGDYSLDPRLRGDDKQRRGNDKGMIGGYKGREEKVRLGNIMARVRMIILFDFAKKVNGLVCGTENKSEHLLGYFTRYGDGASDIEPIQHLFKTQVFELAKYLGVPDTIINKPPSANLWDGQTDEGEFGFTYEEADEVLSEAREYKGMVRGDKGKIREKIIERVKRNKFKQEVPYII